MGDNFRVEVANVRDMLARLSEKGLEPQNKTVLSIYFLNVILQKGIHFLDKKKPIRLLEVLEDKALRKGPCRPQFEDTHSLLNIQVDQCFQ